MRGIGPVTEGMDKGRQQGIVLELVREALASGQAVLFKVRGDSMLPTLENGDQVKINPADPSDLHPGDLAVYVDAGGQIILHRVVAVREGGNIITKGDNRERAECVPCNQVLGKGTILSGDAKTI